jgi:hypothetical protein
MSWSPGEVVVWQEAWRGQTYFLCPVRVVEDSERAVSIYVAEGTRYAFPPGSYPFAEHHPWAARPSWEGHGVLITHNWGESHAIWHFWRGEERRFAGWYVNMQAALERAGHAFITQDHELDIVVRPDGSWTWKDEQALHDWVPRGRFSNEEVVAIQAEGERVLARWPFPTGWEEWEPDPAWEAPVLPSGGVLTDA